MSQSFKNASAVRVGSFELDPRTGDLRINDNVVRLQPQPLQVLLALLREPGGLVTRDELRRLLWEGETFVGFDDGLNSAIRKLREAFDDSAHAPRYIETIARRGYRLIAPVEMPGTEVQDDHPNDSYEPEHPRKHQRRTRLLLWASIACVILAGGALGLYKKNRHAYQIDSLAVLPLANFSGDPDQDYFADGITEELTTDLARIGALRVVSRTSAMRYKGTKKSLTEIGRELGVDAVVEGSVQRSGTRVRITAQLIHAATERHLWADTYERDAGDILSLRDEVARAIAAEVRIKLSPEGRARLAAVHPVNAKAYELYLRGKFAFNSLTPEGFDKGLAYLHRAVETDPKDALAWAQLALAYTLVAHQGPSPSIPDPFLRAKPAALKAIELDPSIPEAHQALAEIKMYQDWDFRGAEQEFRRALELSNDSLAEAHAQYSWLLQTTGRTDEQLAHMKRSQDLDPLNALCYVWLGQMYGALGRWHEAGAQARKALSLDPQFPDALALLGETYAATGKYEDAIALQEKASRLDPVLSRYSLGRTLARAGRTGEARRIAAELRKTPGAWPAYGLAMIYAALGEREEAFHWLEVVCASRHVFAPWISTAGDFDALSNDPRMTELLARYNLPNRR